LKSIRWRLPLNFFGITGLSVIILGIVLVAIVGAYYTGLEQEYLRGATNLLPPNIVELLEDETSQATLQGYLENVAFLSQTRVQVTDEDDEILVDTGSPEGYSLTLGVLGSDLSDSVSGEVISYQPYMIVGRDEPAKRRITWEGLPDTGERVSELPLPVERVETTGTVSEYIFGEFPINLTAFGFNVGGEKAVTELRSSQERRIAIHSPAGLLGYITFLEGPAYGREIVKSVAIGFLFAGALSIVLSGMVGWWISRRLSDPLTVLTKSTTQMAEGDYTIRTDVDREDELGILARTFNRMAEKVEGTVGTLRRFISDAAHELNTPLTALRTNLELAMGEKKTAARKKYIDGALQQATRLEEVTDALLDLSRLEGGALEEEPGPMILPELVREESERYASWAEQSGIDFTLDLAEEDIEIIGRGSQMRRVLSNLLDNAIKFTPEGGNVSVGIRREGACIELWVEDTGIGIPADELHHLFNRFHRARNAAGYPGSGLGLAIVKSIVEGHRGSVWVKSDDQGTRFTISLPASES
jgi:signal transduction histidine kinase